MGALSYLTLDGREVSNSARLDAFARAGLLPSTFQIQGTVCGVLAREAATTGGMACPYLGFADVLSETAQLGLGTNPAYTASMTIVPQDLTGASDGYVIPNSTSSALPFPQPQNSGAWLDGTVVVAFEVQVGAANMTVTAAGRANGQYGTTPGNNHISALLTWASATTANLTVRGWVGDAHAIVDLVNGPNLTVPPGRQWLVLRLAGDVITAEWWTQDPRMGGNPFTSLSYILTGALVSGYLPDRVLFGVPGQQAFGASQTGAGKIALPEWWATPKCTATTNLYPSPFLFPSPLLFPAQSDGSQSVIATTPWTDSSRPESSDFLGFYFDEVDGLDGDTTRSVQQRVGGLGGAALGPLVQAGRSLKFHGWLIGRSCRGLDYGREWLNDILAQTCHPCPDSIARIRVAVPSPDDGTNDAQGLYYTYDVGLTNGPSIGPPSEDCDLCEVEFELTTGNGFKYQAATALLAATTFASANGSVGAQIPTPPGIGTNGAIVTIKAGSQDLLNVYPAQQLSTYPSDLLYPSSCLYPNDGGLPVTLPLLTCPSGFVIPIIPAGGTLVIDSARHRIIYTDGAGVVSDGTYLLSQDTARAIDWLEADACNPGNGDFVLVGAGSYGPDATVQIDVQHRER